MGSRRERPDLDLERWLFLEKVVKKRQDWSKREVDQVESEAKRLGACQRPSARGIVHLFWLNLNCLNFLDKIFMVRKCCPIFGRID